jgi:hypothetical protein
MAYKVDMSLPPADILLGIINYENPQAKLTFQEVKFSEKGVENVRYYVKGVLKTDYMGDHRKIDLVPLPGSRLYRTTTIYFNRINLTDYLAGHPLIITPGQYTDTSELLDEIRSQLGINLGLVDIMTDYISATGHGVIRLSPKSYAYEGTIAYRTDIADQPLSTRIRNSILDGFYPPDSEEAY